MTTWVDIPQHRVLVLELEDMAEFELLLADGTPAPEGVEWLDVHRVVRKRDGAVFRVARFWPAEVLFRRAREVGRWRRTQWLCVEPL